MLHVPIKQSLHPYVMCFYKLISITYSKFFPNAFEKNTIHAVGLALIKRSFEVVDQIVDGSGFKA